MKPTSTPSPPYDREISALFFLVSLVFFVTVILAILFLGEPFSMWQHPFSDLGNTVTRQGRPNMPSRLIFCAGMLVDGYIMRRISACYAQNPDLRHRTVKRWLALLGALGSVVSTYPSDVSNLIHSLGTGPAVGVIYLFTTLFHLELRPQTRPSFFYADLIILQATVLPYAVAFFLNLPPKQSLQKLCILGLGFTLQRVVTAAEESFRPREVLRLSGESR
ncbi:MAG: hypothetical protein U9R48_09405 [Chloroflexota bacterium]|nr:hypothetical protein [Chloroflexota bacterium]